MVSLDFDYLWIIVGKINIYRSFEESKAYVRGLQLRNSSQYLRWAKSEFRPSDIPANPQSVYPGKGWISWGDFLGTGKVANQHRQFRLFVEAREFARSLKLKGQAAWAVWAKTEARPKNIPAAPQRTYDDEWIGWGDFLGTQKIAAQKRHFLSYEEAKSFIQSLPIPIKKVQDWENWAKTYNRPDDIPSAPHRTYKSKGWISWGDFLGTDRIANQKVEFLPYKKAKKYALRLKCVGKSEWFKWAKTKARPSNIPTAPDKVYVNNGWISWGDFLGTGNIGPKAYKFKSFEEARAFVHALGITSSMEWRIWSSDPKKRPADIPSLPSRTYAKSGWQGWGDFLGTGTIANQKLRKSVFLSFEDARLYIRSLSFISQKQYRAWAVLNSKRQCIPLTPHEVYKESGWQGWSDFLGIDIILTRARNFRSFDEARSYVRTLGLKNRDQWVDLVKSKKKPLDIPSYPNEVYADKGWISWGDFLGTGRIACQNRTYRSFEKARQYAWNLAIRSRSDWLKSIHPDDIPRYPDETYANQGWINWGNFLGNGNANPQDSAGAIKIQSYLRKNKISFKREYTFRDLLGINKGSLKFDFYLPDHNLLIEFHGAQHFKPIETWGGKDQLNLTQVHDKIKEDYASTHGYRLLVISYEEEHIIDEKLKDLIN